MVMPMDEYRKRFNVYERIESVKQILKPVVLDGNGFRLRGILLRCVRYRLGKDATLGKEESQALDILLKNKLNPKTVYEWMLAEQIPAHIKEKIVQRKLKFREGRAQYVQWKRQCNTRLGKNVMEEMRNIVGRLKWKSQEGLRTQY